MIGAEWLLNALFPRRCPFCQRALSKGTLVCDRCLGKLRIIESPFCLKCGKPVSKDQELCMDCQRREHQFCSGRSVFLYNKPMKKAIYRFKYENKREYASFFADAIVQNLTEYGKYLGVDGIVPIPLHPRRERSRGYNQAALVARKIGAEWEIPVYENLLIRKTNTRPLKNQTEEQRKNNLKNAFLIKANGVQLKKILLVDDIYTTGSTIDEAARTLKEGGANEVFFISISLGNGF